MIANVLWNFRTHILPNGLEIVAECNPDAYSTALGFVVKTGARDETDEVAGVEVISFSNTWPSRAHRHALGQNDVEPRA